MNDERKPTVFVGRVKAKAMAQNGDRQYKPTDLNAHIPPGVFPMISLQLSPDDIKLLESRFTADKKMVTLLVKKSKNKDTWYCSIDTWEPKNNTPKTDWGQPIQQSHTQPKQQPLRHPQEPLPEPKAWNMPEPEQDDIPF